MALMTVQFDLEDLDDMERARASIETLIRARMPRPAAAPVDLVAAAEQLVRGYGPERRTFLRLVAEAGDEGLTVERAPVQRNALGGLITSLQRSWRATGATEGPVEWTGQRYRMRPDVARAVVDALERTEPAPD